MHFEPVVIGGYNVWQTVDGLHFVMDYVVCQYYKCGWSMYKCHCNVAAVVCGLHILLYDTLVYFHFTVKIDTLHCTVTACIPIFNLFQYQFVRYGRISILHFVMTLLYQMMRDGRRPFRRDQLKRDDGVSRQIVGLSYWNIWSYGMAWFGKTRHERMCRVMDW